MLFRALTTAILVVHFTYLGYVVFGGFLTWRWRRAIWPHLAAAAWGALVIVARLRCPLTSAEAWARHRAGESGQVPGFIDRYIEGVLYPQRYALLMQLLAAGTVAVSWLGGYLWRRHRLDTARKSEESSQRTATV